MQRIRQALAALLVALVCASSPAQAGATSAPAYSVTRYVSTVDPARWYNLGCEAGQQATDSGPGDGIVILDFGQPQNWGNRFGTLDFGGHQDSIATITEVAQSWLQGFWDCTPQDGPTVKLGLGTSNYKGSTTYAHGRAWAKLVNSVAGWVAAQGYGSQLSVRGASDMEIGWNSPANTRAWVDGYNAAGHYPLYDYGDDAGGVYPDGGWTAEDIWYKAYGAALNWPVPEIYYPADATDDWQPLSLWAVENKGKPIVFVGTLTQYAADTQSLSPAEGWQALYDALGSDERTAQPGLPYATDITWDN